jgi:polyphosphate kinase 2 (PPK2 family)
MEDMLSMERHLWRNGTKIIKFFLHLSKEEQRECLLSRLQKRDKLWKFDPRDIEEREFWDDYQFAYQEALDQTHDEHAPWYVIPADDKWTMRAVVAEILVHELAQLDLRYPAPDPGSDAWVGEAIAHLQQDGP